MATFEELQQLVESNARSIQAVGDQISELAQLQQQTTQEAAEERAELRRVALGLANLLGSLDEDRPTVLRRLGSIESKIDRILERQEDD